MNVGWLVAGLLACPVLVLAGGAVRPRAAGSVAAALAGLSFLLILGAWLGGLPDLRVTWLQTWGLPLHFSLDGLAALYALLTTGIGYLVIVYSQAYMADHVHEERGLVRFYVLITFFMAAMVGLVVSGDLYSLLIFWDLTAIASYLLIAFDGHRQARVAANSALVITAGSAVLLLAAAVLLHVETGTSDLPQVFADAPGGTTLTAVGFLTACAAMAKSAQVPLHFWLRRAMVAPTPV
ncbi:MAG: proton-conducting transporter membrane subunit, partial [Vicinamibacteraceae bacterium]